MQARHLPTLMQRTVPLTVLTTPPTSPTPITTPRYQLRLGQFLDWFRSLSPWIGGPIVTESGVHYQWLTHRVTGIKRLHPIKGQRFDSIAAAPQTTEMPAWLQAGE